MTVKFHRPGWSLGFLYCDGVSLFTLVYWSSDDHMKQVMSEIRDYWVWNYWLSSPENNISIHRGSHSRRSKKFPQCVMSLCFLGSYNKKQMQHIQGIVQFSGFSSRNLGRQNKQSHKLVINLLRFFLECLHAPGKNLYHTENVMSGFKCRHNVQVYLQWMI